jgi:DNA mismatch repair ATPase MutS
LEAKEALVNYEFVLLREIKDTIFTLINELNSFAKYIAWFDLYTSHAIFVEE